MFLIRSVTENDLEDLFELSKLMTFINLPSDKNLLKNQITSSIKAFKNPDKDLSKNYYIFVLEDTSKNKTIGVSMIHAKHGTAEEPHFFLTVGNEQKYSQSLNTGFIHGTLTFGLETNGHSEIGGLVLHPEYRNNLFKLGKQLSFSRFLYMSIYPERFTKTIHSELLPPFDKDGNSPLWEAIGRRFMNMDYSQADILSRKNKEFILSLYPRQTIYGTLLPPEARDSIGKVGPETAPVKKMLERIGFAYIDEVDPFDGGPHYRCKLSEISLIKEKINKNLNINKEIDENNKSLILMNIETKEYDFCAHVCEATINEKEIILNTEVIKKFNLNNNDKVNAINF